MDDLVKAVDNLACALVSLALTVEANAMIGEREAVRFNDYFSAFEEHMGRIEGSSWRTEGETDNG